MANGVKIIRSKRRFRCDISGCRTFTNLLITKRGDVSARPLHLCEDCIRSIYALIAPETVEEAPEPEEVAHAEPDTAPEPDHSEPERKTEPKAEPKPNKAKGGRKKSV